MTIYFYRGKKNKGNLHALSHTHQNIDCVIG